MPPHDDDREVASGGGYRDPLTSALARIDELEKRIEVLSEENRALLAQTAVPGPLAEIETRSLSPDLRRRVIQRRVRALRRELRAALGVRRYAASAIIAVSATAAFIVMAAESMASWPLAIAILGMGAVARSLMSHWPGFDELEDRRRKLAALKSQLDAIRAEHRKARALPSSVEPHEPSSAPLAPAGDTG